MTEVIGGNIQIPVLFSKIHRATVTDADLHYEGSITVDRHLMDLAELVPHQMVQIYNITTGARFETYVIEGEPYSGCIQINGAAAHLAKRGEMVIIAAYASMPRHDALKWNPRTILVDERNQPTKINGIETSQQPTLFAAE